MQSLSLPAPSLRRLCDLCLVHQCMATPMHASTRCFLETPATLPPCPALLTLPCPCHIPGHPLAYYFGPFAVRCPTTSDVHPVPGLRFVPHNNPICFCPNCRQELRTTPLPKSSLRDGNGPSAPRGATAVSIKTEGPKRSVLALPP